MITIKINDKEFKVKEDITILEAAGNNKVEIPTLCYLKDVNEIASCRICLVEVKGSNKLLPACVTKVKEGMEIYTETDKVVNARKMNLELIMSNHNKDCDSCKRNGNCELQLLVNKYQIEEENHFESKIDTSTTSIVRDNSKCILCNRCVKACKNIQGIAVIGRNGRGFDTHIGCAFDKDLKDVPCILCGQCILACPTGALTEKDDTEKVFEALNNKDLHVVVGVAPSVRVTLGEEFNFPIGTNVKGKMVNALRQLGFDKVFDVNFGADLTVMEEANELLDRINNNGTLPMFTSCSPGWIKYVEQYYPEMISHLSTCKSPQQMFGAIIKTYYAEKYNIDPKKIVVVSVMPCIAKKYEMTRDYQNASGYNDIDIVITTRELARMIRKMKIGFRDLEDQEFDMPLGIGASAIFGSTGGVMEAALRTAVEILTGKKLEKLEFNEVRGTKGIKEATYNVNGKDIKVAVVSGIKNAKTILEKIKNKEVDYQFVEFMTCPGGCINGGGQPIVEAEVRNTTDYIKLRMDALLEEDKNLPIRKAHENPVIIELYKNYLEKPNSKKAHEILHTKYSKKEKYQ